MPVKVLKKYTVKMSKTSAERLPHDGFTGGLHHYR